MNKKLPTIFLTFSLVTLFGFSVGQEIELTSFLNGRANPNFLKYTKNVQTTLGPGTSGEVIEIKKFNSGNSGIKMKISGGPKAGESYWVYYNKENPALKIVDNKTALEVSPDQARPETSTAVVIHETKALRDLNEQAVLETARSASTNLDPRKINEATAAKISIDCDPVEKKVTAIEVPQGTNEIFTPQQALIDLNAEDLKFVGRELMPGSGQNRSCLFQNSKVIVIYDNCMSSKKEAPVTGIKIISKRGGEMEFYVENASSGSVSKMTRSQYDSTWRISYSDSNPPAASTVNGVKKYMQDNEVNQKFCYIGESFKANVEAQATCSAAIAFDKTKWTNSAESFWQNPPEAWYTTQTKLRKLVEKAPY